MTEDESEILASVAQYRVEQGGCILGIAGDGRTGLYDGAGLAADQAGRTGRSCKILGPDAHIHSGQMILAGEQIAESLARLAFDPF